MMVSWLLIWAATAGAQPLDLRVQPVSQGVVQSIREVHASPRPAAPRGSGPQPVGTPSDIEESMPVGAVVSHPFGAGTPKSEHKWQFGAAGTAEMQAELARTRFEVMVLMDDGERRTFAVPDITGLRPGQRVTVRSGELQPAAGT